MPSYLKALPVILVLAAVVFLFAKAPACESATRPEDFKRRRNLWFAITLIAFLAHNYWIFIVVVGALVFWAGRRDGNPLALYFSLLFAVPMIGVQISGLGLIQHFFTIHYGRLLALTLLLPAFLRLRRQPGAEPIGRSIFDKLLLGYLVLQFLLMLTANTFTNALRHGVFYQFIDVFLPYYVASRGVKDLAAFRDAVMALLMAASVLAAIAVFEWWRHWLLYATLDDALGIAWSYGRYLEREEGLLRAQGTTGQPIPLGYLMAVALGLCLYARALVLNRVTWALGLMLLVAGLIAPVSRGPWVGAAVIFLVFAVLSPAARRQLAIVTLAAMVLAPALFVFPGGDSITKYLPFVGSVESGNIDYRQRLLEIAVEVIWHYPFFGAFDYIYSPAFEELKTGSGVVDIVNTYVGIALASGLVGLSLFLGFFGSVIVAVYGRVRSLADRTSEASLAGQALLATLIGILSIIVTVSSITIVPLIYWGLGGLAVAYARFVRAAVAPTPQRENIRQRRSAYAQPASVRLRAR